MKQSEARCPECSVLELERDKARKARNTMAAILVRLVGPSAEFHGVKADDPVTLVRPGKLVHEALNALMALRVDKLLGPCVFCSAMRLGGPECPVHREPEGGAA